MTSAEKKLFGGSRSTASNYKKVKFPGYNPSPIDNVIISENGEYKST